MNKGVLGSTFPQLSSATQQLHNTSSNDQNYFLRNKKQEALSFAATTI